MVKRIIVGVVLLIATSSSAATLNLTNKPIVTIIGVVDSSIIREATTLLNLASKNKEVNILVNSPGGSVDTGLLFIQAMEQVKSKGVKLNCVSGVLAASMGFQILAHCDRVYALPSTLLLFHPVSISGNMRLTEADMEYLIRQISIVEKRMNRNLLKKFNFEREYFNYHYRNETFHQAIDLAKETSAITIVEDIIGIDSVLYKYQRPSSFFTDRKDKNKLIYIKPETIQLINTK